MKDMKGKGREGLTNLSSFHVYRVFMFIKNFDLREISTTLG